MLDLLRLPILKFSDLLVVIGSAGMSPPLLVGAMLILRSNRFAYMWGDVRHFNATRSDTDIRPRMETSGDVLVVTQSESAVCPLFPSQLG